MVTCFYMSIIICYLFTKSIAKWFCQKYLCILHFTNEVILFLSKTKIENLSNEMQISSVEIGRRNVHLYVTIYFKGVYLWVNWKILKFNPVFNFLFSSWFYFWFCHFNREIRNNKNKKKFSARRKMLNNFAGLIPWTNKNVDTR